MAGVDGSRPNDTPMTQQSNKAMGKWRRLEERQRGQQVRGEERGDNGYLFLNSNITVLWQH